MKRTFKNNRKYSCVLRTRRSKIHIRGTKDDAVTPVIRKGAV